MRSRFCLWGSITLSAFFTNASPVIARTFENTEGKKIEAEMVSATETHVVLKMSRGGKEYTIPLSTLSEADQEYIEGLEAQQKANLDAKERAAAVVKAVEKIVAFVEENKGEKVGDGECWSLANEAFKAAGAKRPAGKGNRVWGRELDWSKEKVLPGDIVELRNAVFPNGTTGPEHTAVVMKKGTRAGVMTVYHANWGNDKNVTEMEFDLRRMSSGEAMVYRYE